MYVSTMRSHVHAYRLLIVVKCLLGKYPSAPSVMHAYDTGERNASQEALHVVHDLWRRWQSLE